MLFITIPFIFLILSLGQAINKFLKHPDFDELQRYYLDDDKWKALEAFHAILSVCLIS